jgi:hypothetical protein
MDWSATADRAASEVFLQFGDKTSRFNAILLHFMPRRIFLRARALVLVEPMLRAKRFA